MAGIIGVHSTIQDLSDPRTTKLEADERATRKVIVKLEFDTIIELDAVEPATSVAARPAHP